MKITNSFSNLYQRAQKAIGQAVVGDDFFRADGTVDGILLGAGTGALVGGAVGGVRGLVHQAADSVSEELVTRSISDPKLQGFRYSVRADWDTDCYGSDENRHCDTDLDGWWHTYHADVRSRVVGSFQEPTLQHSHQLTALSSAATGAAIGAGVGAALGLATGVMGRVMGGHPLKRKSLPSDVRQQLIQNTGATVIKSTAIGAGVGGAIGLGAGLLEQSKSLSMERTWNAPIYENKDLGSIPRNHYEYNWGWDWNNPSDFSRHSPRGETSVVRSAPLLDARGQPRMRSVTETLDSSRLSPLGGLVAGTVVGAGMGFATGIAAGVINRLLVQSGVE